MTENYKKESKRGDGNAYLKALETVETLLPKEGLPGEVVARIIIGSYRTMCLTIPQGKSIENLGPKIAAIAKHYNIDISE